MAAMSLKTSKQVVDALIELSKANERRTQMTLAFQSSNAEFARAAFLVKREKELMDVVIMYREKLKEARTEVASNEVSQKCDGEEYQEAPECQFWLNLLKPNVLKIWMH